MPRTIFLLVFSFALYGLTCTACARNPEITDPAEAARDPDFKIQGEYVGKGTWLDGNHVKVGAQVIAWGDGRFTVVVTKGGLPGDGWRRGDPRFSLGGKREGAATTLSGTNFSGKIVGKTMTVSSNDGKTRLELKRTVRHSPTEGVKPPEGAVVLFDGTTAENFHDGVLSKDKNLMSETASKRSFGDYTLHVEFRLSYIPLARGQDRSNSGVYLHDCYEIQMLDSFGLEGRGNECGALYGIRKPNVNMCYPPLTWQTYDVEFTAPRYRDGKKVVDARMAVKHNGVVIHPDTALPRSMPGRQDEGPAPRPIYFQGHGNKVEYRNIWVKPVANPAAKHPSTGEAGGITGITKGKADLIVPPDTPPGEVWRYGLGFPFQVGPRTAGLFCNIRKEGTGNIDFEIGTDVVLFDDLSKIGDAKPIPLSRYEKGVHPDFGKTITAKGPVIGGFVPFGAKRADGSPYPNAGTGFGLNWAIVYAVDERGGFDYRKGKKFLFELFQFNYDGKDFRILGKEYVERNDLLPNSDWMLVNCSLTNAIPDGQDLLYAMPAVKKNDNHVVSGVTRWRHGAKGWRPISFTPVTGQDVAWSEPSLIRDVDGSLLMSARSSCGHGSKIAFDLAVWRSTDNGKSWKQVVYRRRCRSRSPVTINQAADGTPFVVANLPPLKRTREILCYWPLNDSRTDLGELRIVRDLRGEFGRAPSGSWWRGDHPTSAIVRLADGAWHGILVYRVVDNGEIEGSAKPAPQTGCYVEEVHSRGPATEVWRF